VNPKDWVRHIAPETSPTENKRLVTDSRIEPQSFHGDRVPLLPASAYCERQPERPDSKQCCG